MRIFVLTLLTICTSIAAAQSLPRSLPAKRTTLPIKIDGVLDDAVWKSAAIIHNDGWSFEMFIPFSAIRFSKKTVQDWGMNITRRRRKTEQQFTWNPIDVNVNGFLTQEGYWTGLENIKPPIRLQF